MLFNHLTSTQDNTSVTYRYKHHIVTVHRIHAFLLLEQNMVPVLFWPLLAAPSGYIRWGQTIATMINQT
jgi:hypothetical protein